MSSGAYYHTSPTPLTTRTLDELMKELAWRWAMNDRLTPVEHEILHRWRAGRLTETQTPPTSSD